MGTGQVIPMQFKKIVEVFAIVLIPVSLGMLIRSKKENIAAALDKPVRIMSGVFLVLIIVTAVYKEWENVLFYFKQAGLASLTFNILSMIIGYFVPRVFSIHKKQAISIAMEIGIHNGTMAIYIALTVIGNSAMSITPAIYSLIMFFTAALFGYMVNLGVKKQ